MSPDQEQLTFQKALEIASTVIAIDAQKGNMISAKAAAEQIVEAGKAAAEQLTLQ